jgi:hypothetical protein
LILTTNGGSANVAYQIARIFQQMYPNQFLVCAPSTCKSAGTLIALGANRLLLDMFCDLGPLDVQLFKQNEIGARKSGLLSRSSFEALSEAAFNLYETLMISITMKSGGLVSFRLASELSAEMAGRMLSPVFAQINPDVVGSENRDLNVALQYGLRLVDYSQNANIASVVRLVHYYPSHDFIIDNDECKELFKNVDVPSEELYAVLGYLGRTAYDEASTLVVAGLTKPTKEKDQADEADHSDNETKAPAAATGRAKKVDGDRTSNRRSHPGAKRGSAKRPTSKRRSDKDVGPAPDTSGTPPDLEGDAPPLKVVR